MPGNYSTNTGLSALPEIDQKKYPEIWAELVRIRQAIAILQEAIDFPGSIPAGGAVDQVLTKLSVTSYDVDWQDIPFPTPPAWQGFTVDFGGAPVGSGTFSLYSAGVVPTTVIQALVLGSSATAANDEVAHKAAAHNFSIAITPGTDLFEIDIVVRSGTVTDEYIISCLIYL